MPRRLCSIRSLAGLPHLGVGFPRPPWHDASSIRPRRTITWARCREQPTDSTSGDRCSGVSYPGTIIVGWGIGIGMIEEVETGRLIATEVRPVEPDDFRALGPGWRFDWRTAVKAAEVFKLLNPTAPNEILGLLALKRRRNYVEVTLLESHPQHVGKTKKLRGIPGSLFAFAAELSFAIGGEGFITIDAKTELIEHYRRVYGFERVGNSQRMFLDTEPAMALITQYGGRPSHE